MKTYTIEELKLAQAKKCRIEWLSLNNNWVTLKGVPETINDDCLDTFRIHPADEWKARLPRLREGAEWACDGSSYDENERPLIVGEVGSYLFLCDGTWEDGLCYEKPEEPFTGIYRKTTRPIPPEFLHTDELAEAQTCAIQHNQENAKNLRDPKGFCKVCGTDWPEAAPAPAATPTDTPETDALRESYVHLGPNWLAFEVFAKASERFERRAIAAEARVKELEGALHLLPIAEAGPVPEGMIRLYAHRIQLGPPSAEFWSAFSEPGEEDTHCVDIHPSKQ